MHLLSFHRRIVSAGLLLMVIDWIFENCYSSFVDKYVDPRGIPPSVVEDAIINGTKSPGNKPGTFVYETIDIRVVSNENGDIITVIPK